LVVTTLPARWYSDPDVYVAERTAIFASEWLFVAPASRLVERGDYVAVEVAGWPILVVALGDGALRGFHNVCRHRAGPLVWDGAGHCGGLLVCKYHGWSYELEGGLKRARDFGDLEGFDPADVSLAPVAVESWRGLVFVNLSADRAPSLTTALGGFADACADLPLEQFRWERDVVHAVGANWKTYADNYLEGYHVPIVHPELNKVIDASRYRVDVGDRWCRHIAPARGGSPATGVWLWRFPNLALNVYPEGMNVERFIPMGPRQTNVEYSYFFAPGASTVEESEAMSSLLLDEDRAICEAVQRNLDSGAYVEGWLSPRHERAVAAFQTWVRDAVEAG
jgi:choline monooxygenase